MEPLLSSEAQSIIETCFIFANDNDRNHLWNTSEEPFVYTRS